jgi:putative oxygen-independent coproporphyrinogen III oxidase
VSFGVYVHVPFCSRRCDYCAFATWTDRHHLQSAHTGATVAAITRTLSSVGAPGADQLRAGATSVFFGGGTPSLLAADELLSILRAVPVRDGAEVTVECNPETVTDELLAAYRAGGVTRLSFGVQSMVPHVLESLGREHRPETVQRAVASARRAGFEQFNLDLIYGAAGETVDDWSRTLDEVLALQPPHVSAYALTIEGGTPLAADASRHPDEDTQADCYLMADQRFADAGLANYEISNWAQPGQECRHNWLYWQQGDYLGFGCAAHSHVDGRRWWNVRTPERYIEQVEHGGLGESAAEDLDAQTRADERLQLALRTRDGVDIVDLDPSVHERVTGFVEDGLVRVQLQRDGSRRVVLTTRGRLLANAVSNELI